MNPFRDSIVTSPWESPGVDVPSIHENVLTACLQGIDEVRSRGRSAGLLIHGEAGSGKTHLLRRLRARLASDAPAATDRRECLYVWVRLQTSPRMIWRTLRRTLVDDWFRPVAHGRSQFDRILFHRLAEIRVAKGDLEPWYEYMRDEDPSGLSELMEQIAEKLHLDRNTAVAFEHIAFGRHRRDLRAWLGGTSLPLAALESLNMAQDEGTDEEREHEARDVVLMLCRLAGDGLPIVLSFDQVEALQLVPDDRDALFAFGQLISTLHDGTSNTLLISSVQSSFASVLKDGARMADYARMTSSGALSLDPLRRGEGEQLIAARLAAWGKAVPAVGEAAHCWPLTPQEFDALIAGGSVSPRKLLTFCAEKFETRCRPAASESQELIAEQVSVSPTSLTMSQPVRPPENRSQRVAEFLSDRWESTLEAKLAANTAESTEEIVRHGLPMLARIVAPNLKLVREDQLADVELIFECLGGRSGLSLCAQSNMKSLGNRFKRLKGQFAQSRLRRLVLLRDSRVPLSKTAKVARQDLADLEQAGAVVVHPTVEVLAAIDAIRSLLSDAISGDLNCDDSVVPPQTVSDWIEMHLAADLRQFVSHVIGDSPAPRASETSDLRDLELLNTVLADQPLIPVELAAETLQRSSADVVAFVQRHPEQIGLLGQPPTLVFRLPGTPTASP